MAVDGKLERLKELLAGELSGRKVLIFSSFKDTSRYLHRTLTGPSAAAWLESCGQPHIRRIDSGNHPDERGNILRLFHPMASGAEKVSGTNGTVDGMKGLQGVGGPGVAPWETGNGAGPRSAQNFSVDSRRWFS